MLLKKCGHECVAFIDTDFSVIEIRTPFDKSLSEEITDSEIKRLFPLRCNQGDRFVPIHLLSFNVAEGRVHRICVFFISSKLNYLKVADRVLPQIATLTPLAEREMKNLDGGENLLYWKWEPGNFQALLFWDGRLAHLWHEPIISKRELSNRLSEIQQFLEQDSLFSRASNFHVIESSNEILFSETSKDFFWRSVDLEFSKKWKPRYKKKKFVSAFGILMLGLFFTCFSAFLENHAAEIHQDKTRRVKEIESKKLEFESEFEKWKNLPWVRHVPFQLEEISSRTSFTEKSFQEIRGEYREGGWFLQLDYFEKSPIPDSLLLELKRSPKLQKWNLRERKWFGLAKESGILEGWYVY